MTPIVEGVHSGEWLISDGDGQISRDVGIVTTVVDTAIKNGTVLGQITASKKYVPHNNGASDGSQIAAAILLYDIPAGAGGDVKATLYTRHSEVWGAMLNQGAGVGADVVTELAAKNIIVR